MSDLDHIPTKTEIADLYTEHIEKRNRELAKLSSEVAELHATSAVKGVLQEKVSDKLAAADKKKAVDARRKAEAVAAKKAREDALAAEMGAEVNVHTPRWQSLLGSRLLC